ncbi:hypothetical protein [Thiocystis violacea]|uniref:hypothetical protein n=1 Tax=Thiocystis violacea TaxID=13725 RepID=UPI001A917530|nr:hypothetical protein [Thiocystis violacea]
MSVQSLSGRSKDGERPSAGRIGLDVHDGIALSPRYLLALLALSVGSRGRASDRLLGRADGRGTTAKSIGEREGVVMLPAHRKGAAKAEQKKDSEVVFPKALAVHGRRLSLQCLRIIV